MADPRARRRADRPARSAGPWVPYALLVGAAGLWAALGIWMSELLEAGLEPIEIGFWRAAIGSACFIVHATALRERPVVGDAPRHIGLGIVGVAVFFVALPRAVDAAGIGLAWVLLYTAPGFVLLVRWFATRTVHVASLGVLALVLTGIALVAGANGSGAVGAGVLWGLISGAAYASHYVVGAARRRGGEVSAYAVALAVGATVLLPLVTWASKTPGTWILLASTGVVSTYLPFLALSRALRRIDSARAAMVATLEPVFAVALGVALYAEPTSARQIVGALMVVCAAGLGATRSGAAPEAPRSVRTAAPGRRTAHRPS